MPGQVMELRVQVGDHVKKGQPVAVLSAMKMETTVSAPCSGTVSRVVLQPGDHALAQDLLLVIEP